MAVNLGDIVDDGRDIHGEGINIAARLEGLSEPGGIVISGDVYNQVKNRIDAEYQDLGLQEVKNVAEPVQAYAVQIKSLTTEEIEETSVASHEKPSIAVLPFDNMSGDSEQEYFSDGITEDIITALSHLRWLNVIARNSSFTYKGQSPDIRQVADELNCRYVLEGSIRKAGNRVRINAQLLEGLSGNHIWAEKYDRELEDIFDLQDEITEAVLGAIEPSLVLAEIERAKRKHPESMDAYDLFLQSLPGIYSFDPDQNKSYVPYVVETSIGLDRMFLAVLSNSLVEEELENSSSRTVLKIPSVLAPYKAAILPLVKKDGLSEFATSLYNNLKTDFNIIYDEKDAVGRRYRRQDAIGTPLSITVDHQTLEDNTVTIRDRDTMDQNRVPIDSISKEIEKKVHIKNWL